ncbi:MAG: 2-amino-4-hydroxy-6-hydroxymethyldihydropteridine diphosphokinase [Psychrilyobacter sp.]|nr:2-amino-4-hydroxy-6-hydroxymethyldihydropteridine diphosphokinase [Psychrilyobacter sp.]
MKGTKVYLSLGSNIGNKFYYLLSGIFKISKIKETRVAKISNFYSTNPVGYLDQDLFLNCAIEIETNLSPRELLTKIQGIELELERVRTIKWGPRTLDIDIIMFGELEIDEKDLVIPHKEYKERDFVLIPLLDIIEDKKIEEIKTYIKKEKTGVVIEKKKKVLVSRCLLGDRVSYKKNHCNNYIFKLLEKQLEIIKMCPEVDGGLPSPRPSAEILGDKVVNIIGEDRTKEFKLGGEIAAKLSQKNNIDLAFMKGHSPSCGLGKVYDGTFTKNIIDGNGIAVSRLLELGVSIIEVNEDE